MRDREQYYFDTLKPEYNILKVAGSSLGRKVSEETKALLSLSATGRIFSPEMREKKWQIAQYINRLSLYLK